MNTKEFEVGDEVYVERTGMLKPATVMAVHQYKIRAKITLDDKSVWDSFGDSWDPHGYSTAGVYPRTEARNLRYLQQRARGAARWIADHWDYLSAEQAHLVIELCGAMKKG